MCSPLHGRESSDPKELDLLARISAQQRRYRRARRLWESALKRSPGNADFERAIERTRDAERFQAILRKGAMLALLLLAVTAIFISVRSSFHRHSPSKARGGEKQPDIHDEATPLPSSSPQLTQPASTTPQPSPATATPQPVPATP
jgi:ferric-dicitrate binding protein FerR (iron transport regulator)